MPSQYNEHETILKHFGDRAGRFLDIGAFDGKTFSNTHCLAERGWKGVLLEPSPASFVHLVKTYEGNKNVDLVNAGLAPVAGLVRFWANSVGDAADALSSFDPRHVAKFPKHPFREIWATTITWDMLLENLQGPYDFVNIDVEGWNLEIMDGLCTHMSIVRPEMVCIELDPPTEEGFFKWKLERAGLVNQEKIGGNLLAYR